MQKYEKKDLKKKSINISDWYTDVCLKAELADYGPVRGTMVIRPYGYAIWENVQRIFDEMFTAAGVQNAYFPLFIPYSLLQKEKEHVKGFSPELALVTHGGGDKLPEPLAVRPTSETIMYEMYSKWISSWRDLPMKINQWNNVVRWEKRTYLFLRTLEFLWQEGHCAHATHEENLEMVLTALEWYRKMYEEYFAMPTIYGLKSEAEKFAGAVSTYTVESLMPDGKALQACTSHDLGQNFSKPQNITFQNKDGKADYVWQNSWGFSTRSVGGLIMVHGDDNGLVIPPKIAPIQVVIIPIFSSDKEYKNVLNYSQKLSETLSGKGIKLHIDIREGWTPGRKFNDWEVKGVPLRLEAGSNEIKLNTATLIRRDTGEKVTVKVDELENGIVKLLNEVQENLFAKAKKFLDDNTHTVNDYKKFKDIMETKRGFIRAYWCEDPDCEAKIKEETKATVRVKPLNERSDRGNCVYCGKKAGDIWYFAQAY